MTLRTLDKILLVPVFIVLGSLSLAACSSPASAPDSSSSSPAETDDQADEGDDEETIDYTESNCPDTFTAENLGLENFEVISPSEFAYPEVGLDLLATGCLFNIEVAGSPSVQQAYLPGDATDIEAIGATLLAAGYTAGGEDAFAKPTGEAIGVSASAAIFPPEALSILDGVLGYGEDFVVLTGLN